MEVSEAKAEDLASCLAGAFMCTTIYKHISLCESTAEEYRGGDACLLALPVLASTHKCVTECHVEHNCKLKSLTCQQYTITCDKEQEQNILYNRQGVTHCYH